MSMFICERCRAKAQYPDVHDYCAKCSRNLCDDCMKKGCCGNTPALSGLDEISEEFFAKAEKGTHEA